ncbi:MAG: hypothetical protein L0216_01305 [Planctomycetales bacterium]|nr:hypothetical protein [Planctomycetales bacterium]
MASLSRHAWLALLVAAASAGCESGEQEGPVVATRTFAEEMVQVRRLASGDLEKQYEALMEAGKKYLSERKFAEAAEFFLEALAARPASIEARDAHVRSQRLGVDYYGEKPLAATSWVVTSQPEGAPDWQTAFLLRTSLHIAAPTAALAASAPASSGGEPRE